MLLCICVFLSYIPDAGQMSCIFLYLSQVIGFTEEKVTSFIAVCGILSILAQTVLLTTLMQTTSKMTTIMIGLAFQTVQLFCYAFGHDEITMWTAGALYAVASMTFPAISALVSTNATNDQQVKYKNFFFHF
jgi:predicted MFS family arabinose efflux permease